MTIDNMRVAFEAGQRTPDPLAEKLIEAAETLTIHLRKGGYTGSMFQDVLKAVTDYQNANNNE